MRAYEKWKATLISHILCLIFDKRVICLKLAQQWRPILGQRTRETTCVITTQTDHVIQKLLPCALVPAAQLLLLHSLVINRADGNKEKKNVLLCPSFERDAIDDWRRLFYTWPKTFRLHTSCKKVYVTRDPRKSIHGSFSLAELNCPRLGGNSVRCEQHVVEQSQTII